MRKEEFTQLHETVYHEKLENGLEVYIVPKPTFSKTYATFTTRYGSIDNEFQIQGQDRIKVPDGIAHFLEHKMFEEEEGDVFMKFASHGASANAFTSFDRTAYLFSSTRDIDTNLETLLDFVQNPYFTHENVEKEKGIIGQEIRMYEDDPDWRVYFGLIESLYHQFPVRIDIAGTVASIQKIDKDILYRCYETFYHPGNMLLFVVGNVDPEKTMDLIRQNQGKKTFKEMPKVERFYPQEPAGVGKEKSVIYLPVGTPKCFMGFKDRTGFVQGDAWLKREVEMEILMDILFSPGSAIYQKLYERGLINDGFGGDFTGEQYYGFSVIGGDTKDPEQMVSLITDELQTQVRQGIDEESFTLSKRKKIGEFLRSLNSLEYIANSYTRFRFAETDLFKTLDVLEKVTLQDVNQRFKDHFDFQSFAVSIVTSKE